MADRGQVRGVVGLGLLGLLLRIGIRMASDVAAHHVAGQHLVLLRWDDVECGWCMTAKRKEIHQQECSRNKVFYRTGSQNTTCHDDADQISVSFRVACVADRISPRF